MLDGWVAVINIVIAHGELMDLDSLFSKGGNYLSSACLNFQPDMSHGYIYGYKKAGDVLTKDISRDHSDIDYLIYPIVFLYRHHIELQLKNLLELNFTLYQIDEKVPTDHKIKNMWPRVKGYYRKLNNRSNQKEICFIDKIIYELCGVDSDSMNFRYSKSKNGKIPNENLKCIDIEVFSAVIGKVSDALETYEYQLNAEIDKKCHETSNQP